MSGTSKIKDEMKPFLILAFEKWGSWKVIDEKAFFDAIETDAELVEELNGYDSQYLDTYDREWMFEVVTSNTVGMPWPCYGDTDEMKEDFVTRMANSEVYEAQE